VPCDEICEVENRNSRIAAAFNVDQGIKRVPFTAWAVEMAAVLPDFVAKIENQLSKFLKEKDPSNATFYFPPMSAEKRQLIHEMVSFYGLSAQSIDQGTRRFVRITRFRTSRVPKLLLSEAGKLFSRSPENVQCRGLFDLENQLFDLDIKDDMEELVKRVFYVHGTAPWKLRLSLVNFEGDFRINPSPYSEFESIVEGRTISIAQSMYIFLSMNSQFHLSWSSKHTLDEVKETLSELKAAGSNEGVSDAKSTVDHIPIKPIFGDH